MVNQRRGEAPQLKVGNEVDFGTDRLAFGLVTCRNGRSVHNPTSLSRSSPAVTCLIKDGPCRSRLQVLMARPFAPRTGYFT